MKKSLSIKTIKTVDKSNMLDLLLDFPVQCKSAFGIAGYAKILFEKRDFTKIVFSGLGGSAIGADLVKSYLFFDSKIPINVYRGYELPAYVDNSTLVFISSYSGNTEETLSTYHLAKERGAYLIVVSSGGKLKDYAQKDGITFIELIGGLPPRSALGYSSIIPLCILAKLNLIKALDITGVVRTLEELRDKSLNPRIGLKDNIAKLVATELFNKYVAIYSSSVFFDVCATRLRNQLNENSKTLALSHVFPEMNHNEIVGWQNPKKIIKDSVVLMLRDKLIHPRISKRMDITRDMFRNEGFRVMEIWSRGEDLLSRIFSLIYIGDFISFYLAITYGVDPTPVDKITYLKKELAKNN